MGINPKLASIGAFFVACADVRCQRAGMPQVLFRAWIVSLITAMLAGAPGSVGAQDEKPDEKSFESLRRAFKACRDIADADERVRCYDQLQIQLEPPRFEGRLSSVTPLFSIEAPSWLRYRSDGPVFVMALKNEHGEIVQNLHLGGGGEARYRIAKPGRYSLQISGTDGWRIWIDPAP
jgi:hypothetical protein